MGEYTTAEYMAMRAQRDEAQDDRETMRRAWERAEAEVERLRGLLIRSRAAIGDVQVQYHGDAHSCAFCGAYCPVETEHHKPDCEAVVLLRDIDAASFSRTEPE